MNKINKFSEKFSENMPKATTLFLAFVLSFAGSIKKIYSQTPKSQNKDSIENYYEKHNTETEHALLLINIAELFLKNPKDIRKKIKNPDAQFKYKINDSQKNFFLYLIDSIWKEMSEEEIKEIIKKYKNRIKKNKIK